MLSERAALQLVKRIIGVLAMAPKQKRARTEEEKPTCKYGAKCYRKNQEHWKQFAHPGKVSDDESTDKDVAEVSTSKESSVGRRNEDKTLPSLESLFPPTVMPPSPTDVRSAVKQKFLLEMPEDFYEFWEFCKTIDTDSPEDALLDTLGLQLVGPYDVLSGKLRSYHVKKPSDFLLHWRYYYDPPEMQTVLRGDDDDEMYHIGYFRDNPSELPVFLVSNAVKKGCSLTPVGGNIFAAVNKEIEKALQKKFSKSEVSSLKDLKEKLEEFTESKFSLSEKSKNRGKVLSATFHGAGMVVPCDSKTQVGYRPLTETNANLKKILTRIAESKTEEEKTKNFDVLQEIITNVQYANDECDYGMGLELGIDLFCFGDPSVNSAAFHLLSVAYTLLGWHEFADIADAHLHNRKKTSDLSVIK